MTRLPGAQRRMRVLKITLLAYALWPWWACGGGHSSAGDGVTPTQHVVELSWHSSASTVVGYKVYRGTQHLGPYVVLNSMSNSETSFTDSTVQSGITYYYVVTAVDAQTLESEYTNEGVGAIPTT